jgi:hypothetical protein
MMEMGCPGFENPKKALGVARKTFSHFVYCNLFHTNLLYRFFAITLIY